MNELPVILEIKANLTIDERVELILDLTRRLELLDELLSREGMFHAEGEKIIEAGCGCTHR